MEPIKKQTIGEIKITNTTSVKVSTFQGSDGVQRLDIRVYVEGANYTGPTKKGVVIPVPKIPELIQLLQKASK